MPNQEEVNRFLAANCYMAPSRSDEKRYADLAWRFPAEDVRSAFTRWQHLGHMHVLPEVQAEFAQSNYFCNCGTLLDFSSGVCPGCNVVWCPF